MSRSTVTALRLVPALAEPDPTQEQLPGLALAPAGFDRQLPAIPRADSRARRARSLLRVVGTRAAGERGMATAEYAVGLVAACAFALVLYKVVNGTPVVELLNALAQRALTFVAP
jgi:hypothetical protein